LLDRIVALLTKLGQRGYAVHEDPAEYVTGLDSDTDPDTDTDGEYEQTDRQPLTIARRRRLKARLRHTMSLRNHEARLNPEPLR
jgi:hypothetical protein